MVPDVLSGSALGCTADSRRAAEAGHPDESVHRRQVHATTPALPSQSWRTFLTNHASQMMAADFFVVPTVTFRLLVVLVILAHDRGRNVHVAVTNHPPAAWTARQRRNAFPEDQVPHYLVHDRDGAFAAVATTIAGMGIQTVRTAPSSPWQNAYIDRNDVDPRCRLECGDHVRTRPRLYELSPHSSRYEHPTDDCWNQVEPADTREVGGRRCICNDDHAPDVRPRSSLASVARSSRRSLGW